MKGRDKKRVKIDRDRESVKRKKGTKQIERKNFFYSFTTRKKRCDASMRRCVVVSERDGDGKKTPYMYSIALSVLSVRKGEKEEEKRRVYWMRLSLVQLQTSIILLN